MFDVVVVVVPESSEVAVVPILDVDHSPGVLPPSHPLTFGVLNSRAGS